MNHLIAVRAWFEFVWTFVRTCARSLTETLVCAFTRSMRERTRRQRARVTAMLASVDQRLRIAFSLVAVTLATLLTPLCAALALYHLYSRATWTRPTAVRRGQDTAPTIRMLLAAALTAPMPALPAATPAPTPAAMPLSDAPPITMPLPTVAPAAPTTSPPSAAPSATPTVASTAAPYTVYETYVPNMMRWAQALGQPVSPATIDGLRLQRGLRAMLQMFEEEEPDELAASLADGLCELILLIGAGRVEYAAWEMLRYQGYPDVHPSALPSSERDEPGERSGRDEPPEDWTQGVPA